MTYRVIGTIVSVFLATALFITSTSGRAAAAWQEGGNPVCTATGDQWYPKAVSGGLGSSIMVWQDHRSGGGDIILQKLDEAGLPVWLPEGVRVCSDPSPREFFRQAVPDGEGGVIVVWTDHRSGRVDIYAQRIGPSGQALWPASGVAVSTAPDDCVYPSVAGDGSGGIIVAWQQGHDPSGAVLLQRIGQDGQARWPEQGVSPAQSAGQRHPVLTGDGSGGAVVVWSTSGTGSMTAQRIDRDGAPVWGVDGVEVAEGSSAGGFPRVCWDGGGSVIIAWEDMRNGDRDVYAQRLGPSGAPLWTTAGVALASGEGEQWFPVIASDGSGGIFAAWVEGISGETDIRASRLDQDSGSIWPSGTVDVCVAEGDQLNPRIAGCGGDECIIVWQDSRNTDHDIYAQKIGSGGIPAWQAGGMPVAARPGDQRLPELIADAAGGALVTWEDWGEESDVFSLHIGSDGRYLATELAGFDCRVVDQVVELTWSLSSPEEEVSFCVDRRAAAEVRYERLAGQVSRSGICTYVFTDPNAAPDQDYLYRVSVLDGEGEKVLFETEAVSLSPLAAGLMQNCPNPFNPVTSIEYRLAERVAVEIVVFDPAGRRVRTLRKGIDEAGRHVVVWDGLDGGGDRSGSGVYFCRMTAGKKVFTRKMVLLR